MNLENQNPLKPDIKSEKLFGKSHMVNRLEDNDLLYVGGSIISNELSKSVRIDTENLKDMYSQVEIQVNATNLQAVQQWLENTGIKIDAQLFVKAWSLQKILDSKINRAVGAIAERLRVYNSEKETTLSEIFENGSAECAEIAAAAKIYLESQGFNVSYIGGEVLWSLDDLEFAEPHSYLFVQSGDGKFIYDPSNPTDTSNGSYPSFYTTEADFIAEVHKGKKVFVTAQNIWDKSKKAYFGVGDLSNVTEDQII